MVKEKKTDKSENKVEIKASKKEAKTSKEVVKKPKKRKTRRQRRIKDQIVHNYIPKHEVLNQEELSKLQETYDIEKFSLIDISDPAIRHLEVNIGDVIKISRKNEIVGDITYYRKVIR